MYWPTTEQSTFIKNQLFGTAGKEKKEMVNAICKVLVIAEHHCPKRLFHQVAIANILGLPYRDVHKLMTDALDTINKGFNKDWYNEPGVGYRIADAAEAVLATRKRLDRAAGHNHSAIRHMRNNTSYNFEELRDKNPPAYELKSLNDIELVFVGKHLEAISDVSKMVSEKTRALQKISRLAVTRPEFELDHVDGMRI